MENLIHLFKNKTRHPESFQDEEVKNKLPACLHFEVMEIVAGYLDLMAAEIAPKFDINASQRASLGLMAQGPTDKPLLTVEGKQFGSDDSTTYREFEQVFAFQDGSCQNWFTYEICTYCNKKVHTETICFA